MGRQKLRVSFIDFLNSVPLGWGFLEGSLKDRFELLFDVPSQCARHLAEGQADVGLIPVIEYQRIPELRIIPDLSVASKQEVQSVLFVSRLPIQQVRRVALDTSSRTSVVLLKILLNEFYEHTDAQFVSRSPDPKTMLRDCDAALIIGNPALKVDRSNLYVYDLAHEWSYFTGLPFVFAFWAARPGTGIEHQVEAFYQSRREGLAAIGAIAATYAARLGLDGDSVLNYLTHNLNYSLDSDNISGLLEFFRLARKHNLTDGSEPLRFAEIAV